jgi:hypothetical protein
MSTLVPDGSTDDHPSAQGVAHGPVQPMRVSKIVRWSSRHGSIELGKMCLEYTRMQLDTLTMQTLFRKHGDAAASIIKHGARDMPFEMRQEISKAIQTPRSQGGDVYPCRFIAIMEAYGYKKTRYAKKRVGIPNFQECNKILGLPEHQPANVQDIHAAFRKMKLEYQSKWHGASPEQPQAAADEYGRILAARDRLIQGHKSGEDKRMVIEFEDNAAHRPNFQFTGELDDIPPPLACHILVNYSYVPAWRAEDKRELKRAEKRLLNTEEALDRVRAQRRALESTREAA